MDGPPAQSLGVEPVDPSIMSRPPRPRTARVLTRALIQRVLTSATIIMLGTLLIYVREMSLDHTVSARDTTMTFTCFVFFDMFNALTCRSEGKSVLRGELSLVGNRMFNVAVGGSLLGQAAVVYVPFLQRIFQTEGLGGGIWSFSPRSRARCFGSMRGGSTFRRGVWAGGPWADIAAMYKIASGFTFALCKYIVWRVRAAWGGGGFLAGYWPDAEGCMRGTTVFSPRRGRFRDTAPGR